MNLTTHKPDISLTQAHINDVGLFWSASCVVEIAYAAKGYIPKKEGFKKFLRLLIVTILRMVDSLIQRGTTIVAFEGDKAVGTLSIYQGSWKLPIESDFREMMILLRKRGEKITYLGKFATNKCFRGKAMLSGLLFQEAQKIGHASGTTLYLCVVNPCHLRIYQRLGFTEVARQSNASGLTNAPAVLLQVESKKLKGGVILRMTKF